MNGSNQYKFYIIQIINEIKDTAVYIKDMDIEMYRKGPDFYSGMQYAYSKVLENIKEYIECNEDLDINDFDLNDDEIEKIINLKPEGLDNLGPLS